MQSTLLPGLSEKDFLDEAVPSRQMPCRTELKTEAQVSAVVVTISK